MVVVHDYGSVAHGRVVASGRALRTACISGRRDCVAAEYFVTNSCTSPWMSSEAMSR